MCLGNLYTAGLFHSIGFVAWPIKEVEKVDWVKWFEREIDTYTNLKPMTLNI